MIDIVDWLREAERLAKKDSREETLFVDAADEITRLREENSRLLGLLREAHVKMDANNLWSNLRNRVAAAIREGGE